MDSAFLVFDLVGGNAGLECERNAGRFVHPKLNHGKEAVGLSAAKRVSRVPTGNASPN